MNASPQEREAVLAYFADQMPDDEVVHLEKVAVERVGSFLYDIWDVHCTESRWWAINNMLNFYPQDDFKSRDVALTFHVGLMVRMSSREEVPVTDHAAALLPKAWRLWEQSIDSLDGGREAEDFQAVGVRLRECMVTYAGEVADGDLVPEGADRPQAANVKKWNEYVIAYLAAGSSSADKQLRIYLRKITDETWDLVSQLTHSKNAKNWDAQIAIAAVSHFLSTMTAVRMRWTRGENGRCAKCGSYRMVGGTCFHCGWTDDSFVAPELSEISDEELAARLATSHTPSSGISTYVSPDDFR